MDPARKQRRNGILIVIAVLVVVGAFWIVFVPHTKLYRAYKSESKIKERLQTIKPPAAARLVEINTSHVGGWPMATGMYSTESDSDSMKTHYKEEFARHGFTFKTEDLDPKYGTKSIYFSSSEYDADLSFFRHAGKPWTI
jgi:hypothetical protein